VVALGSYMPILEIGIFNLDGVTDVIVFSVVAILVISLTLGAYSFLRIAVRGIAEAPDELLDERQIQIRNTSYRYAYLSMGYLVLVLLILVFLGPELQLFQSEGNDGSYLVIATLFALASAPSMFIAWRERDV
ncbi:MAG: hypothetical protein NWS64_03360, partial [Microbacteriaceae bacterium]|nr:hypothetical protein [Microbacteriaceae bacterium]